MTFRFVCRGRNCAQYVADCITSVKRQTVPDWTLLAMVDPEYPEDYTSGLVGSWCAADDRIECITNGTPMGVCYNMYSGIQVTEADPEDVVVILDLDDYLCRDDALAILKHKYEKYPNILCTYGSFILEHTGEKSRICKPYKEHEQPRRAKWRATHLKSFKYKLFQHIPKEYFMDKGEWGQGASDLALMFSIMEVAGMENCRHIGHPLYFYRNNTPNSLKRDVQRHWEKIWRHKKPLTRQF